jgi:hypothetical protein
MVNTRLPKGILPSGKMTAAPGPKSADAGLAAKSKIARLLAQTGDDVAVRFL